MLKNVIFHMGTPKTGTSIIQSHLAQNRAALRDKGFLYPVTISTHKHLYRTYESHHLLTYSWADWQPFNLYDPDWFFDQANETAAKHDIHTLLLSAENTYWLPYQLSGAEKLPVTEYWERKKRYLETMRKALEPYQTTIVLYLRRQDRWIESWYNQQVKNGHTFGKDMDRFANHFAYLIDYETQLELLSETFGKNNVTVGVYEKHQLPEGLFAHFCELAGLGDPAAYPLHKKARYNAQLSPDALEFMEICNKLELDPDQKRRLRLLIRRATNQFESQIVFQAQSLLSPEQRRKLIDQYAPMNKRIATSFLGRKDGRLFLETEPEKDADWTPYPGLPIETLTQLVMQVLVETTSEAFQQESHYRRRADRINRFKQQLKQRFPALAKRYQRRADNAYWNRHIWDYQQL